MSGLNKKNIKIGEERREGKNMRIFLRIHKYVLVLGSSGHLMVSWIWIRLKLKVIFIK